MEQMSNSSLPQNQTQASPRYLIDISDLLGQTWQIYKQKIFTLLQIQVLPILLFILAFLFYILFNTVILPLINTIISTDNLVFTILFILVALFIALVFYLMSIWYLAAVMHTITLKEKTSIWTIYRNSLRFVPALLWIWILIGLVSFTGYFLFIVPGIIISIWLFLANWALVDENYHGFSALVRSKALISGKWWDMLANILIINIVIYIINQVFYLINLPINLLANFISILVPTLSTIVVLIPLLLQVIVFTLVLPIQFIFYYLLFQDLKTCRPSETLSKPSSLWMKIFAIISPIIIILAVIVLVGFGIISGYFRGIF